MGDEASITFKEFLEGTPPGVTKQISDLHVARKTRNGLTSGLAFPEIEIHCDYETCSGVRVHRPVESDHSKAGTKNNLFVTYRCSNCRKTTKTFSLECDIEENVRPIVFDVRLTAGRCYKHGERPLFGPPVPKRLVRLFQTERDSILKALRCENQGLGIAAFAYYRRVVENKKDALFDRIIKVAQTVGTSQEILDQLAFDKVNIQFSNSASTLTSAVPDILLFGGENPLILLHSTLSAGIHGRTDEECLKDAHDVRVILVELVRLMDDTLAEQDELKGAIKRLAGKKSTKVVE